MKVERKALICYCLGVIQGRLKVCTPEAKLILDQKLIQMNQPPITKEEAEYIQDLSDEIGFTLMQMGVNRKEARKLDRIKNER